VLTLKFFNPFFKRYTEEKISDRVPQVWVVELYYWVASPEVVGMLYYRVELPDIEFNIRVLEPHHSIGIPAGRFFPQCTTL
jgi:hypothetical protein